MDAIYADAVLIATGGCGQLWERTTNPSVATGDGLAMSVRGGCVPRYGILPISSNCFDGRK